MVTSKKLSFFPTDLLLVKGPVSMVLVHFSWFYDLGGIIDRSNQVNILLKTIFSVFQYIYKSLHTTLPNSRISLSYCTMITTFSYHPIAFIASIMWDLVWEDLLLVGGSIIFITWRPMIWWYLYLWFYLILRTQYLLWYDIFVTPIDVSWTIYM
jgi:hypothetical protein